MEDDVAKLPDRSFFAGSIATMDRCVRTMVNELGLPLQETIKLATVNPARLMPLDRDRVARMRGKERWLTPLGTVPFGAFFILPHGDDTPWVQLHDGTAAWSHAGYTA